MTMRNIKDYNKIKKGKYNDYLGHTVLFKSLDYENKNIKYWDQNKRSYDENWKYTDKKLKFRKAISFKYKNEYYDLEDIVKALEEIK